MLTAAAAGCSGSSGAGAAGGSPATISAPPSGQPSLVPAFSPPNGAADHPLRVTATLTAPDGRRVSLRSSAADPADVYVTPGGQVSLEFATTASDRSEFNLSGAAATGRPIGDDRISITGPGGLYVDSTYPDLARCTTRYTAAGAHAVAGEVACEVAAPVTGRVMVQFRAG